MAVSDLIGAIHLPPSFLCLSQESSMPKSLGIGNAMPRRKNSLTARTRRGWIPVTSPERSLGTGMREFEGNGIAGAVDVGANQPPHLPAGIFSPVGRRDKWRGRGNLPLLPTGEKVPEGRMRGPHGTTSPILSFTGGNL